MHELDQGEKLDVLTLGALTNIASAILLAPSENQKFSLKIFVRIDAEAMEKEFYEVLGR